MVNCHLKLPPRLWVSGVNERLPTGPGQIPSPLHCMGKSAQVIDEKGLAIAPLRKRVRILLDVKEIEKKGRKQKVEGRNGTGREMFQRRCREHFEAQCKKSHRSE